ncbi:hypothetical protein L0668_09080 [Paraglaciecola aquimarina]|uniref:Uncharacterized protein n=1 Tax=Paraglaciecola algarum TaxID=3050085 RepID=A0ABS9D5Q2_9ALTE|nr:hypothetical protein [Paraglaciecola sp. G1-23]
MTKITRISFAVFSFGYLASLPLDLPLSGLLKILPILTLAIAVAIRVESPKRHFFRGC